MPLEPSPTTNNATLAGIDVNKNGVRDDVERVIAVKLGGTTDFPLAISYAKAFQRIITSDVLSPTEIMGISKESACSDIAIKSDFDGPKIKLILANTVERQNKIRSVLSGFGGQMISEEDCK